MQRISLLLKQAWETRALILFTALVFFLALCKRQQETIAELRGRPIIEHRDRIVEKIVLVSGPERVVNKIVTVQGPERIVEKIVKGDVVERIVYRDPVTTTTDTKTEKETDIAVTTKTENKESTETPPQLPAESPYLSYVGFSVGPLDKSLPRRARAGRTLWRNIDAGVSWDTRTSPSAGGLQLEVSFRF